MTSFHLLESKGIKGGKHPNFYLIPYFLDFILRKPSAKHSYLCLKGFGAMKPQQTHPHLNAAPEPVTKGLLTGDAFPGLEGRTAPGGPFRTHDCETFC